MDNTDRALLLVRRYLDIEQPDRALETLQNLSDAPMQNPDYWYLWGSTLFELKRYPEAVSALQKGLAFGPDYTPLLYMMCNCQDELGNLAEAERAILSALRITPDEPNFLCRYAYLVAKAGQLDKAGRLVDEAARFSPHNPMVLHARAALSFLRGNDKAAGMHSRKMLEEDPENPAGHYMYGISQYNAGNVGDAARHLGTVIKYDPKDRDTARIAHQSQLAAHWLLWPLRLFSKFGAAYMWIGAVLTVLVLCIMDQVRIAKFIGRAYLILCIYSWVMPPILRWWYKRRYP